MSRAGQKCSYSFSHFLYHPHLFSLTHTHTHTDVITYKLRNLVANKLNFLWDYLKWKSENIGEQADITSVNIQKKILKVDCNIKSGADSF